MAVKRLIEGVHVVPMGKANAFLIEVAAEIVPDVLHRMEFRRFGE